MNRQHHLSSNEFTRSIEENLEEKSEDFAKLTGGTWPTGNPAWFTSGIKCAGYNGIPWTRFVCEQLDRQVDDTLDPVRRTDTPLTWWTGPSTQPENLGRVLQVQGFIHVRDTIGMAADLRQLTRFIAQRWTMFSSRLQASLPWKPGRRCSWRPLASPPRKKWIGNSHDIIDLSHCHGTGIFHWHAADHPSKRLHLHPQIGFEVYCKFGIYQRTWK